MLNPGLRQGRFFISDETEMVKTKENFVPRLTPSSCLRFGKKEIIHGSKIKLHHNRNDVSSSDERLPVRSWDEADLDYCACRWHYSDHRLGYQRPLLKWLVQGFSHFLTKPIDRKNLYDLLGLLHSPLSLRL
jgi:hypothetical protein